MSSWWKLPSPKVCPEKVRKAEQAARDVHGARRDLRRTLIAAEATRTLVLEAALNDIDRALGVGK